MATQSKISRFLREARLNAGFSLRQLAQKVGTSHSTIAAYEQGRKTPSSDVFLRVLNSCGLDLATIQTRGALSFDPRERGQELAQVLDLAGQFPARHKPDLDYPQFQKWVT